VLVDSDSFNDAFLQFLEADRLYHHLATLTVLKLNLVLCMRTVAWHTFPNSINNTDIKHTHAQLYSDISLHTHCIITAHYASKGSHDGVAHVPEKQEHHWPLGSATRQSGDGAGGVAER
jgi:hypothetical protein